MSGSSASNIKITIDANDLAGAEINALNQTINKLQKPVQAGSKAISARRRATSFMNCKGKKPTPGARFRPRPTHPARRRPPSRPFTNGLWTSR